jgi:hypothetical protein
MVLTLQKFSQRNGSQKKIYWGVALETDKTIPYYDMVVYFFEKQLQCSIG